MTTEEKAKAYDEALERAKNIKSKILQSHLSTESCKAVSEYINEIISELRESEDERTRKNILALVKKHAVNHERCQMEAYLEKQKEQKPAEWTEEDKLAIQNIVLCLSGSFISDGAKRMCLEWFNRRRVAFQQIQPYWKPSEEQIEMLDRLFKVRRVSLDDKNILLGLIADLQKL